MAFRAYRIRDVVSTHDGDTVTVHLDMGLDQCHTIALRLLGVFAAELAAAGGAEAKAFTVAWLAARKAHPLTCYTALSAKGNERNTLGRWVGDVHDDSTGESLCVAAMAWLVAHPASAGGTGAPT